MEDFPIRWAIWGLAFYIAFRCLLSMTQRLNDRLQGLLSDYILRQRIEMHKKKRILELRERIRAKKAKEADEGVAASKRAAQQVQQAEAEVAANAAQPAQQSQQRAA